LGGRLLKALLFIITYHILFFTQMLLGGSLECFGSGQASVYDLSNQLGIAWSIITPPTPRDQKDAFHMLSPHDGAAVFSHGKHSHLCAWNGTRWQNFFSYEAGHSIRLFKVEEKIWFVLPDTIQYRSILKYYDGKQVFSVQTPQANGIRALFFSDPNTGWAGCEWGQLMQWDGREWRLSPNFTHYHTEQIFAATDTTLIAKNDIPAHNCIEFFERSGKQWNKTQNLSRRNGDEHNFFLQKEKYFQIRPDSLSYWQNSNWTAIDFATTPKDTLFLSTAVHPSQFVWTSHKGPVRSENYYYLENQNTCNDSDIICIVPMELTTEAANSKTFIMFSKTGLQRILRIVAQNYLPPQKTISFNTVKVLQSGDEAGVCIADFTGDGQEDVYAVVSGAGNRLYPAADGRTPGRFDEIAEEAGVTGGTYADTELFNYDSSTSNADIDNDGDQDILVTSLYGPSVLFRQKKKGKFDDHTKISRLDRDYGRSFLGVWADVDRDGCIDLFVNNSDSASHFYQNNGAGIFSDNTGQAGLSDLRSASARFGDIDNDGDDDLICAGGRKIHIFKNKSHNNDIHFSDEQPLNLIAGADSLFSISSLFLADLDNDGDLDLFLTRIMTSNLLFKNEGGKFTKSEQPFSQNDKEYSMEAAALDADNDGDLDIYVSNRGSIAFYENIGNLQFKRINAIDLPKSDGGSVAVGDFQNDGDLDIYTADSDAFSRTLFNNTNNNKYIKLRLIGTNSNRDAIGAQVDIYRADSSRHYLGMRTVNGGQGRFSSSSRIIHVGVPDNVGRTFVIRFPSGIIRHIDNIAPGQFLTIQENEGLSRHLSLLKSGIRRYSRYKPLQNDMLFLSGVLTLFVLTLFILKKFFEWNMPIKILVLWLPFSLITLLFFLLHRQNFIYDYIIPASIGGAVFFFGLVIAKERFSRQNRQPEIEEALYFKTAAFFHGEWGASRLNMLALYLANIDTDVIADSDVKNQFVANINDFFTLLAPEIDQILQVASQIPDLREQQRATRKSFDNFVTELNELKVKLALAEIPSEFQNSFALENIRALQQNIKLLRRHVSSHFSAEICKSLQSQHLERRNGIKIKLELDCPSKLAGRIRPAEFSQIMDNLIHNAERAMKNAPIKYQTIKCRANMDRIIITISDTGCGIPDGIAKRLFSEQFSTKKQNGGFGLYHAAKILARYGGNISLQSTQANVGTTFLMELKRIDHE
jgi:enediyne biosynthesis protein E4